MVSCTFHFPVLKMHSQHKIAKEGAEKVRLEQFRPVVAFIVLYCD